MVTVDMGVVVVVVVDMVGMDEEVTVDMVVAGTGEEAMVDMAGTDEEATNK